jgi:hypothetical protein
MERIQNMKQKGTWIWAVMLLAGWMMTGCGPLPDMVSTEKKGDQKYSADDVRRMTVDQPFQISGDYFREREQKPSIDLGKVLSDKPEGDSASKPAETKAPGKTEQEKQLAQAPAVPPVAASVSERPVPAPVPDKKEAPALPAFPTKVGIVLDTERIPPDTARDIMRLTPRAIGDLPLVPADPEKVQEVMARVECPKKDLACLSVALGVYPGARMVTLVEEFSIPQKDKGSVTAKISVVDTGLMYRYPVMEITVPIENKDKDAAIAKTLQQPLILAAKKSEIMPWFCRAFSAEKGEWYVSAGKASGLKPGDKLQVTAPGKTVKSPVGLPAGWLDGAQKGTLTVIKLFGEDFAVCVLDKGDGPAPEDLLMRGSD